MPHSKKEAHFTTQAGMIRDDDCCRSSYSPSIYRYTYSRSKPTPHPVSPASPPRHDKPNEESLRVIVVRFPGGLLLQLLDLLLALLGGTVDDLLLEA